MIEIASFQETLRPYLSEIQFSSEDEMFEFVESSSDSSVRSKLFRRAVAINPKEALPPGLIGSGIDFLYSNYFTSGFQLGDLILSYKPDIILCEFTYMGTDINENSYTISTQHGSIYSQYHYDDNSIFVAKSFEDFIRVYLNFNGPIMQRITDEDFKMLCDFLGVDVKNPYWLSIREFGEPILRENDD